MADEGYKDIISAILEQKVRSFGQLAVMRAKSIKGLEIDADRNITSLSGDPQEILRDLIKSFEEIAGKISTVTIKKVIFPILQQYPDIVLPEELK
ncbi:MAG: hypothetical protein ACE5J5_02195 [Candidatus Hydrothermarchaeales archaeon]